MLQAMTVAQALSAPMPIIKNWIQTGSFDPAEFPLRRLVSSSPDPQGLGIFWQKSLRQLETGEKRHEGCILAGSFVAAFGGAPIAWFLGRDDLASSILVISGIVAGLAVIAKLGSAIRKSLHEDPLAVPNFSLFCDDYRTILQTQIQPHEMGNNNIPFLEQWNHFLVNYHETAIEQRISTITAFIINHLPFKIEFPSKLPAEGYLTTLLEYLNNRGLEQIVFKRRFLEMGAWYALVNDAVRGHPFAKQ